MRQVPDAAVTFVAAHEGCKLESYLCPAQTWTIGYGSTRGVHAGMRITQADARKRLAEDLKEAAARLAGVVKREVLDSLTENQYSALLSFVFNLGAGSNWESGAD